MGEPRLTLDPDRFKQFLQELGSAGYVPTGDGRSYVGPLPNSLVTFTSASEMTLVVHDPWPYRQPSVIAKGIDWWHAAHDAPCLWQPDDNTKRWLTLAGILERIDEWAQQAKSGFTTVDGAALDPQLYFASYPIGVVGLDINGLIGRLDQDGQHGPIHLAWPFETFAEVRSGRGPDASMRGHWFYRTSVASPPRAIDEFEGALTDNQRRKLGSLLNREAGKGLFVLGWPTVHGTAALGLVITETPDGRDARVITPTPTSRSDRLRRAGPDAAVLADKKVVQFGFGAVGSHLGSLLARSGIGSLTVVDGDIKVPVGLVRHAFGAIGISKVDEARRALQPFEWTTVEGVRENMWDISRLGETIEGTDLCIDATGNSLFAELLSRVAGETGTPFVGVALFRGGRVVRVRRQAEGDRPLTRRAGSWRYPPVPMGDDPTADFLGAETGCAAAIHNAPPASVTAAASTAMLVIVDFLTDRSGYPDEVIDVLEPIEAPFNRLGRHRPEPPPIMLAEGARAAMVEAASEVQPRETGGILIGAYDDAGACCVAQAVEFRPDRPSAHRYQVPAGVTQPAIDAARLDDDRLEYAGEWHSHPTDQPASPIDTNTMLDLAQRPETGDPTLFVLRPIDPGQFLIDAYAPIDGRLQQVQVLDVGGLPPQEQP